MEKGASFAGMAGTAAAIAAFVSIMSGGGSQEAASKAARAAAKHPAAVVAGSSKPVSAPQLLRRFLGADTSRTKCGAAPPCYDLDVLLATVPDPFDSHLDWLYDSQMEALRRGFERNGYVLDSFWTPWQGEEDVAAAQPALRDSHPGVLLFRDNAAPATGALRVRVLLVVGESPGSGLHTGAFRAALGQRAELLAMNGPFAPVGTTNPKAAALRKSLRVVGPAFSGSVGPMRRVLGQWVAADPARLTLPIEVVSGSATRDANAQEMNALANLNFSTTVHTVGASLAIMDDVLTTRMNIPRSRIAIVEESGTAYGAAVDTSNDGLLHVALPMNVGALRAEADQEDPRLAEVRSTRAGEVPLDLSDPGHPRESPGAISELAAPVSDVVVDQLVGVLRRSGVRAVGLQFTDVRDQLFLAGKIRERMHDVQLFAFGSNSLFLRSDRRGSLLGMLTLSSYPPMWQGAGGPGDGARGDRRMLFADDAAEGTFNAVLVQLGHPELARDYSGGAGLPASDTAIPPLWVSAVGARGFVPVAVLDAPRQRTGALVRGAQRAPAAVGEAVDADALDGLFVLGLVIFSVAVYAAMGANARRFHIVREVLRARRVLGSGRTPQERAADAAAAAGKRPAAPRPPPPGGRRRWPRSLRIEPRDRAARREAAVRPSPVPPNLELVLTSGITPDGVPQPDAGPQAAASVLPLPTARPFADGARRIAAAWARAWAALSRSLAGKGRSFEAGPELEQAVRIGSLLLHTEMYGLIRLVALAAAALPPLTFFVLNRPPSLAVRALIGIVTGAWLCAGAVGLWLAVLVLASYTREGRSWALRPGWNLTTEGRLWAIEVLGRTGIAAMGLFYAGTTLWYCYEVLALQRAQPLQLQLLLSRAVRLDSGLSPLPPLLLSGAAWLTWGTWQADRVRVLSRTTAFEAAFLSRGACLRSRRRSGAWARRRGARRSLAELVEQVRDDLFLLVPRAGALLLVILLALVGAGLMVRSGRTLESAALLGQPLTAGVLVGTVRSLLLLTVAGGLVLLLPRHLRLRAALGMLAVAGLVVWRYGTSWLTVRVFAASSFDLLFAFSVAGTLATTTWGVLRLLVVWDSLRRVLGAIEETPLRAAFKRLPERITRIMRLTVMGGSPARSLDAALRAQWACVLDQYAKDSLAPYSSEGLGKVMEERKPWVSRASWSMGSHLGARFEAVYATLERLWRAEGSTVRAARVLTGGEATDVEDGRYGDDEVGRWKRSAEDLAALQVVDYVQWVLQALHKLAVFLFLSLLISTLLLSCYPFPGQSAAKGVFVVVLVVTVATLLVVMVQMNRDDILSRISGTTAGKITWDSSFILNAIVVGVVPLVLLVSSEFPAVREFVSAALAPLVKTFGG